MSNTAVKTMTKQKLSIKAQVLASIFAIVGAAALPQVFHALGAVSGMGTSLGEAFLPMHLPIILVGLLAGPYAGAISGLLGPLVSFGVSGMPGIAMLPFMMIELCAYGLFSGMLRNVKIPVIAKVVIAQVAGRAVRAAAVLVSVYAVGNESIAVSVIWTSIAAGIFGIALQWVLIPLIIYRVEDMKKYEK